MHNDILFECTIYDGVIDSVCISGAVTNKGELKITINIKYGLNKKRVRRPILK